MRAISLWQPWASAIPLGLKAVETRGRSTAFRGELAIHAARRWAPAQRAFASTERALGRLPGALPFGAIVAVVNLKDVRPATEVAMIVSAIERLYGDYRSGRFGWLLDDVRPLREPVPCQGRQSFWTLDPAVEEAVRSQL